MPSQVVAPLDAPPRSPASGLVRVGQGNGSGSSTDEDIVIQPQTHGNQGKIWTVDGWGNNRNNSNGKKPVSRKPSKNFTKGNSSGSDSDSYSGDASSSSPEDTTSSAGSIGCGKGWVRSENTDEGCCKCMCPRTSSPVRAKPEISESVVPMRRPLTSRRVRFWRAILLKEDNARFLLLALVLIFYMVIGALIFQAFEEQNEIHEKKSYLEKLNATLMEIHNDVEERNVTVEKIEELMYIWGNMTNDGHTPNGRPKWNFAGSFHFVYTVVSTIGYGAASPRTQGGKIFCIFYGLLGCSSGILFFNLFLERIITLLAFIMRSRHERKLRKRIVTEQGASGGEAPPPQDRRGSEDSLEESLDAWKPSVYWVMFYLTIASVIVALLGAVLFLQVEQWSYSDSVYFCFISFATIGFGDFVSAQEPNEFYGSGLHAYRFFNFAILVLGCCCIYSLFNVISITIKQFLNWIIKRTATCCGGGKCRSVTARHNAISPSRKPPVKRMDGDIDSVYGSETERKLSGEMVSMREYITTNKTALVLPRIQEQVSLAVMQKQLYETAQLGRSHTPGAHHHTRTVHDHPRTAHDHNRTPHEERFTPGQVGPLAIASSKLLDR